MADAVHPVLRALFDMLPPAGATWTVGDQRRWLVALAAAIDLIYGAEVRADIERITVRIDGGT